MKRLYRADDRSILYREVIFMSEEASHPEKKPRPWVSLAAFIAVTLGAGGGSTLLTRKNMDVYETIVKPSFAPPGWAFPVAWSALYAAMAVAIWLVWRRKRPGWKAAVALYFAQLAVNVVWPVIFFNLRAFGLGFFWLVLLWALVILLTARVFRDSRVGGWLLVPYAGWTTFAAALNFMIARLN